ncbi:ABC transporter permease subunit [Ancylobacter sp. 6x-1]|uniref:ABC transporter permease subunit n=1 Tax=Ancylobacter crimeensis TaxID=2579147 RepID=A0ABT0DBV1_9HYPH|nr:ABC transporter permease subunit [Ancylobacter crimeensis]MCK0197438.1 ABC transporter permease subunit [Ancylobacter crimeensis]
MKVLTDFLPIVLHGMLVTVALSLGAMVLATAIGLGGAWARLAGNRAVRLAALAYTVLVRGMPPLVLMLLLYFGGQTAINATADALRLEPLRIEPFTAGIVSIGVIFGAYLTETFRGAYLSIPQGEIEAGIAVGMPPLTLARVVVLPPLMRLALPGYWNIWLTLVKSCALVSVIGLQDAVYAALSIGRSTREPFTFMLVVMVLYLAYTGLADLAFRALGRRLARGTRTAGV